MKVYCYYTPSQHLEMVSEWRLIQLWIKQWSKFYEPVVLNEWHASKHPYYPAYLAAVDALPSVNPGGYDRSCYLRWLAMAQVLGPKTVGLMSDYDVMAYGAWTERKLDPERLNFYGNTVPCLVQGTGKTFLDQCIRFADYQLQPGDDCDGRQHISDMMITTRQDELTLRRLKTVKEFGEKGWERAGAVHYANARMTPAGLNPRCQFIPSLRS